MDAWTADLIKDASNVGLGWFLGMASSALTEWWKEKRRNKAIKTAVRQEFREVAHRLLAAVYRFEGRLGNFDRALLEWTQRQAKRYDGPNPKDGILAGVKGLLDGTDEKIAEVAAHLKETTGPQFVPKLEAQYTASIAASLHDLEPNYARRVLDVLSHVQMFNEARENGLYYSRLTFTVGLSPANHDSARANVEHAERQMLKRARIVVDKIAELEDCRA